MSQPTIDTSPEKVKKAARASQSNLESHEDRDTIIKRLEEKDNIKPTNFARHGRGADQGQARRGRLQAHARAWVTPEPGAGLIRDKPKLIAPTELYAYPGRGGLLVYALDEEGNRIPLKEGEERGEEAAEVRQHQEPAQRRAWAAA